LHILPGGPTLLQVGPLFPFVPLAPGRGFALHLVKIPEKWRIAQLAVRRTLHDLRDFGWFGSLKLSNQTVLPINPKAIFIVPSGSFLNAFRTHPPR
jgi:hypothetical protein